MKNAKWFEVPYVIGKHAFSKGIEWSFKKIEAWQGKTTVNFDMGTVNFKCNETEITIDNDQFEIIISEYIRRKKDIKKTNKQIA